MQPKDRAQQSSTFAKIGYIRSKNKGESAGFCITVKVKEAAVIRRTSGGAYKKIRGLNNKLMRIVT